jgi:3-hydroxyacyl-CoA dehydrogenase/enoyl-CoA hydratase/3-hydroxybutyryl-CoA epimerase
VAQAGTEVRLRDTDLARVGKGLKAALGVLDFRLKRRRISRFEYERQAALLTGTGDWSGFSHADLVIEAVFEDLEIKQQVMSDIEAVVGPDAVIATNTSTIPISEIGALMRYPQRFLGMHYFSPVDRMPLLEVIPGANTAPSAIATAVQYGRKMGKTVIVVADSPGFWVNRILSPYMNEAGILLSEGVPIELLDKVMTQFGFPVGPVTLLDEVGLDVAVKAGGVMYQNFGERFAPSGVVPRMVDDGRLGRKSGKGFYLYEDGKKGAVDESAYDMIGVKPVAGVDELMVRNRLSHIMLNEAAMATAEGVVRSPRDGDIGAIFGIGFPPFRGGPLRMIDAIGASQVVKTLESLVMAHGSRFEPCAALREMADRGTRYYES